MAQVRGDYLVLHLSELVRVAFMAATSESDPLRLEGLKTMEVCKKRSKGQVSENTALLYNT